MTTTYTTRPNRPAARRQDRAHRRHLAGYAYAANGNVHNPTPRYEWDLLVDGRYVDSATRRRTLVEAALTNGATYLAEIDERA